MPTILLRFGWSGIHPRGFVLKRFQVAPFPDCRDKARVQRRVLIVPDKFKGTLTAKEAAQAIARGWKCIHPQDSLELLPMSDGGDGFGPVVGAAIGGVRRSVATIDAAGRVVRSPWWFDPATGTAVVESALTIGLAMLPRGRFHPFELDSFGLGAVLKAAERAGASRCLIGIGGSATNDGGFGLARSLGWKFFNKAGKEIIRWIDLSNLHAVEPGGRKSPISKRIVAVDVANPLLGPRGCSRIYGPQKGLRPEDMPAAEAALRRMAEVLRKQKLASNPRDPGAGAAGGLGFGLHAFWGARLTSGFEVFASCSQLERCLDRADLVITGEGSIDASSLMGKGVGEIVRRSRARRISCLGLGGVVSELPRVRAAFDGLFGAGTHLTTPENALSAPAHWLERLSRHVAARF